MTDILNNLFKSAAAHVVQNTQAATERAAQEALRRQKEAEAESLRHQKEQEEKSVFDAKAESAGLNTLWQALRRLPVKEHRNDWFFSSHYPARKYFKSSSTLTGNMLRINAYYAFFDYHDGSLAGLENPATVGHRIQIELSAEGGVSVSSSIITTPGGYPRDNKETPLASARHNTLEEAMETSIAQWIAAAAPGRLNEIQALVTKVEAEKVRAEKKQLQKELKLHRKELRRKSKAPSP